MASKRFHSGRQEDAHECLVYCLSEVSLQLCGCKPTVQHAQRAMCNRSSKSFQHCFRLPLLVLWQLAGLAGLAGLRALLRLLQVMAARPTDQLLDTAAQRLRLVQLHLHWSPVYLLMTHSLIWRQSWTRTTTRTSSFIVCYVKAPQLPCLRLAALLLHQEHRNMLLIARLI